MASDVALANGRLPAAVSQAEYAGAETLVGSQVGENP